MDVSKIAELIGEVGLPIVSAAVVIVLFIMMVKNQQRWFGDLVNKLSEGVPLHQLTPPEDDLLTKVNSKIYNELHCLRETLSADRACIYLYHNGGKSSSGFYFSRMSCISEVVSPGISPISLNSQGLHKGPYTNLCTKLASDRLVLIDDTHDLLEEDSFLYYWCESQHAASRYLARLTDSEDHDIGFISVDYCSDRQVSRDKLIKELKVRSNKISSLVDIRSEEVD